MAYYGIPAGGLRVDGAAEGDILVAVTHPVSGDVVFVPAMSGGFVPTFIAAGQTFTVPANRQALFAMDIDNEGTLDIEGYLIQVD